jgi:predicted nucleic acid-binding protein
MRLLIDGNIILDVLQNREPHVVDSAKIWKLCETDQVEGYVSGLTFSNLVYIMRKELSPEKINEVFKSLGLIFRFTDLTVSDLAKAAEQQWDDFEDALQAATAERIHADNIITRNVKDFKKSKIVAFTPTEFLARL